MYKTDNNHVSVFSFFKRKPLVKHILEVGDMNRQESFNLINQLSLEFFDQYLRQEKSKILNNLQLYPNITVH